MTTATTTDITGLLKGNGSTVSAAVADTDYVSPSNATLTGAAQKSANLSDLTNAATARTNLKVPASDITGITGADAITNIVSLTQAEYNAIGSPSATTLYCITD